MSNIDLNLLVIFDAIMQEQSITSAADSLAMTQPSVSNAVSRMRNAWKDPIFVKYGRGIRPSPYANKLWQNIKDPLSSIRIATNQQQFNQQKFNASTLNRTFRITATDCIADSFWLPLRQLIEKKAPLVNIHAVPYTGNGEKLILNADVDIVLDYFKGSSPKVLSQHLFDNHFVCAMRPSHPLANEELTLEHFAASEHLLLSLSGDTMNNVDTLLQKQGLKRRISMTVNHCHTIENLLINTNMLITIPLLIVLKSVNNAQLIIKKLPFSLSPEAISMTWHARHEYDPEILWLKENVFDLLNQGLYSSLHSKPFQ